jgi:3D (Asp-Asp-Asp) domain-containing protein
MRKRVLAGLLVLPSILVAAPAQRLDGTYVATAYAITGITASGEWTHRHVIAADPDILPIGTRIKIRHAGRYSGEYVVADTGAKIQGRRLDIYMPTTAECKKFGVKRVKVQVIQLGDGTRAATKQADHAVKEDVAHDVEKGAVGDAATELDSKDKASKGPGTAK